jgi:hypothetical protein
MWVPGNHADKTASKNAKQCTPLTEGGQHGFVDTHASVYTAPYSCLRRQPAQPDLVLARGRASGQLPGQGCEFGGGGNLGRLPACQDVCECSAKRRAE